MIELFLNIATKKLLSQRLSIIDVSQGPKYASEIHNLDTLQRRIQNPVEHPRWRFLQKCLTAENH